MKHELELKVQAWLDGELPDLEARRMGELIAHDSEAAALAAELGCIRQAIFRQEAPVPVAESREFYWSKIQRQIEREARVGRIERLPWIARLRRYTAPLAGAAALACLLLLAVVRGGSPAFDEISSTGDGMEAVTFHDQSAQMTVVWLQDSSAATDVQPVQKTIPHENESATVIDLE